jgi:hypothetical protein
MRGTTAQCSLKEIHDKLLESKAGRTKTVKRKQYNSERVAMKRKYDCLLYQTVNSVDLEDRNAHL